MNQRSLTTLSALKAGNLIGETDVVSLAAVADRYAIAITPDIANLIDRTDPADPIARQFVPDAQELLVQPEEMSDPIGDRPHTPVKGIVHRYPDRVLLKAVHVCPVYCRFCFRREMVGPAGDGTLQGDELREALAYIANRKEIWEVILTGGDPLVLSPRRMRNIMAGIAAIEHVKIVRLHTRVPAVDPAKIDRDMIDALTASGKTVYLALHANHPRELSAAVRAACGRLTDAGITLVSQTVLLKGVNDDVATLTELMRGFVEARVKPYYLHHPDLAPGTAHFRISLREGRALVKALRGNLSGLCQPTYVLDLPGGHGKVEVSETAIEDLGDGTYALQDYRGTRHIYADTAE